MPSFPKFSGRWVDALLTVGANKRVLRYQAPTRNDVTPKKYSVFISSTFEDLREERRAVQDTIIELGDFPVQMETFPASDQDAFDLISSLLDQCDYYVLIIAGRYGSFVSGQLSFTHREFRYAVDHQIPVLVMLHGNRGLIPAEKTEPTEEGRRLLEAFIEEASQGRTRKTWLTTGDLKSAVSHALGNAKLTKPRTGWVRGDTVASLEVLEQLNEVRQENARFRDALGTTEITIPHIPLPGIEESVEVDFQGNSPVKGGNYGSRGSVKTTWLSLFLIVQANLRWGTEHDGYWIDVDGSCVAIGSSMVQEVLETDAGKYFRITPNTLHRLTAYYIEAGLMQPQTSDAPFTEAAHRLARSQHFIQRDTPAFVLSRGTAVVNDPNDDIPF